MFDDTSDFVRNTCKIGQGEQCCRYLASDGRAYTCAKLDPGLRVHIEKRIEAGTMQSKGDNCEGKPYGEGL